MRSRSVWVEVTQEDKSTILLGYAVGSFNLSDDYGTLEGKIIISGGDIQITVEGSDHSEWFRVDIEGLVEAAIVMAKELGV